MKRRINIFVLLYHIIVFLPIALTTTLICAVATCIMIPICGNRLWGYFPGMVWAKVLCTTALVRIKIEGRENIAPNATYIFAANHQSLFDIFLVYGWLGTPFRWVMRKELRQIPFVGKACEMMGHIFIDRNNAIAASKSLKTAEEHLQRGSSIFIFPEGTRTKDGKVARFKRGAFIMARDMHLPIVPVTIKGAYEVLPYHGVYIKPGTITMILHQPVSPDQLCDNINETISAVHDTIANSL